MESAAFEVRLRNHDERLDASHRSVSELRNTSARHETEIKVTGTEVREIREDIGEMKRELARAREEQKGEMVWIRRGLWAAAASFMTFVLMLAAVILQAGGS